MENEKQEDKLIPVEEPKIQTSIFSTDPETAMQQMEKIIQVVASKCKGEQFISVINGRQYPKVEWWTTVAAPLGLFPVTEWSKLLERDGEICYEAKVSVKRNGQVVTSAEAICSNKEDNWKDSDEYAIKSMSITRATGKAYRIGLSMLAVMAGLEPTPSEEIPPGGFNNKKSKLKDFDRDSKVGFGKHKEDTWREVDSLYLEWIVENMNKDYYVSQAKQELETRKKPDIASEIQINKLKVAAIDFYGEQDAEGELHLAVQKKYGVKKVEDLTPEQAEEATKGLKKALS